MDGPENRHEAWEDSKRLAAAILRDRAARRKWIARLLLLDLLVMAAGLWWIDSWLAEGPMRFLLWWGGCAALTLLVMLFAVHDALAAVREERERHR